MPEYIYLDYNATTPVLHEVRLEMDRVMKNAWGNPSSSHMLGQKAKRELETARKRLSSLINCKPSEIVFTSGGTESNNMAIIGCAMRSAQKGRHLITTRIEHPSVLNPFVHLMEQGFEVDFVGPDKTGVVDAKKLATFIRSDTTFCSVMLANNETGALQPVSEIGKTCRQKGIIFHVDAAQAVGKIPVDVSTLQVDLMTIAGHKLYAPKGIGALYVREGTEIENIMFGAGQEGGRRPGTEPVPGACALGMAASIMKELIFQEMERQARLRELLFDRLSSYVDGIVRFVPAQKCLPNTLSVSFPGISGGELLSAVPSVLASTGAACHDRSVSISHVLSAMGVEKRVALGMVRMSLGIHTKEEDVEEAAKSLGKEAARLMAGAKS